MRRPRAAPRLAPTIDPARKGFKARAANRELSQVAGSDGPWVLMAGFLTFCLGLAPVATLTTDTIVGIAPRERAGAAAAISETGA